MATRAARAARFVPTPSELPEVQGDDGIRRDGRMASSAGEAAHQAGKLRFPPSFFCGAATAAYQVEGGLHACNWSEWEASGRNHGHSAGRACDMWNTFESDVRHMKDLGVRMYRFSVDWSRVEPLEGAYYEAAIDRYVRWCTLLRAAGIEPMLTLHHFVHPAWFDAKGGWERGSNVACFARFVTHVCARLGPHCRYWCTMNELNGFAVCGWLAGVHPPGKKDDVVTLVLVVKHMLMAHARAAELIRAAAEARADDCAPIICMALNHIVFTPTHAGGLGGLLSAVCATILSYLFNFLYVDLLVFGRCFWACQLLFCLLGWRRDLASLRGSVDWLGVNHYYRAVVRVGRARHDARGDTPLSASDLFIKLPGGIVISASAVEGFEKSDMGWDLTPSSMRFLLSTLWRRYRLPLIVTESGIADGDEPDERRIRYLASCLGIARALQEEEGVDLRGYLIWTLLDNFEWAEGFAPRFGLLKTDFETLERSTRASSAMIKRVFQPE